MGYDPRFGPTAQTPEQRAFVLAQLQATFPYLRPSPISQPYYARYIAGELSWNEVRSALGQVAARGAR